MCARVRRDRHGQGLWPAYPTVDSDDSDAVHTAGLARPDAWPHGGPRDPIPGDGDCGRRARPIRFAGKRTTARATTGLLWAALAELSPSPRTRVNVQNLGKEGIFKSAVKIAHYITTTHTRRAVRVCARALEGELGGARASLGGGSAVGQPSALRCAAASA